MGFHNIFYINDNMFNIMSIAWLLCMVVEAEDTQLGTVSMTVYIEYQP